MVQTSHLQRRIVLENVLFSKTMGCPHICPHVDCNARSTWVKTNQLFLPVLDTRGHSGGSLYLRICLLLSLLQPVLLNFFFVIYQLWSGDCFCLILLFVIPLTKGYTVWTGCFQAFGIQNAKTWMFIHSKSCLGSSGWLQMALSYSFFSCLAFCITSCLKRSQEAPVQLHNTVSQFSAALNQGQHGEVLEEQVTKPAS